MSDTIDPHGRSDIVLALVRELHAKVRKWVTLEGNACADTTATNVLISHLVGMAFELGGEKYAASRWTFPAAVTEPAPAETIDRGRLN